MFCVRERELRQKKNGEDFLKLILSDRTGTAEAVAWEEVGDCFAAAEPGSVVHVSGRFSVSPKFGRQITIEARPPRRRTASSTATRSSMAPRSRSSASRPTCAS